MNRYTPLGEIMRHRKGSITIDDATTYKLCRVQVHRRGVVLRQELTGAAISTKKQQALHRIQAEKARLIAAKQLRPEKPLPKITPAEMPFEIPKSWEWCRLDKLP
jgi:hypothetical protein